MEETAQARERGASLERRGAEEDCFGIYNVTRKGAGKEREKRKRESYG